MTNVRPLPPQIETRPGYAWRVSIDDTLHWRLAEPWETAERSCRYSTRQPCPHMPVAAMYRGRSRSLWFYCRDHMYGRWIEDGHVVMWVLRPEPVS